MIMGMNTFRNLLVPLATLILALAIIGGAVYAYQMQAAGNRQNDSLISSIQDQFRSKTAEEQRLVALAQVQASLQSATTRLSQLRAALSPVAAIADAYDAIKKGAAALAAAPLPTKGPAAAEIAAASKNLADTLQAWKILISTIPPSGPSPSQLAEAEHYAQQAQTYINQIQTAADNLTPSNSGLTQNQIDALQTTASAVADGASKTSNDLATALPVNADSNTEAGTNAQITDSGSNPSASNATGSGTANSSTGSSTNAGGSTAPSGTASSSSGVTAADVAAQQQVVDQLQQQENQLEQASSTDQGAGGTTTAPSGTEGDSQPPQLQFDAYGRPILIQGTNSGVYHN